MLSANNFKLLSLLKIANKLRFIIINLAHWPKSKKAPNSTHLPPKNHYSWQKAVGRFISETVSASLGDCIREIYKERELTTSNHVWI